MTLNISRTSRRSTMPNRNESLRHDRSGSVIPDQDQQRLPPLLDEKFQLVRLIGDGNTAVVYEVIDKFVVFFYLKKISFSFFFFFFEKNLKKILYPLIFFRHFQAFLREENLIFWFFFCGKMSENMTNYVSNYRKNIKKPIVIHSSWKWDFWEN